MSATAWTKGLLLLITDIVFIGLFLIRLFQENAKDELHLILQAKESIQKFQAMLFCSLCHFED